MPLDALREIGDNALLVLYANGDRAAAAELTARLTPMVFSLARRLLNDTAEAEDITQEVRRLLGAKWLLKRCLPQQLPLRIYMIYTRSLVTMFIYYLIVWILNGVVSFLLRSVRGSRFMLEG